MSNGEKVCMISFDEMKIDIRYMYDRSTDRLYCGHEYVQVVMARDIIGNFKQPVYYAFDKKMTKDLLLSMIMRAEAA